MGVDRLNAVQKATYFFQKSKVGKNEECTVTVKTATIMLMLISFLMFLSTLPLLKNN